MDLEVTAVASGTCSEIQVKMNSDSSGGFMLRSPYIADASNAPAGRLAKQVTSTAVVAGWNTIALEASCSIVEGAAYWLAVNSDYCVIQAYLCYYRV